MKNIKAFVFHLGSKFYQFHQRYSDSNIMVIDDQVINVLYAWDFYLKPFHELHKKLKTFTNKIPVVLRQVLAQRF